MKINSNSIRKLIVLHIFLVMIFMFVWSTLSLPWSTVYIFDALVCIEFAWVMRDVQSAVRKIGLWRLIPYFLIFGLYLVITQVINLVSPFLSILAFRRVFRFFMFYFACAILLTVKELEKIMNILIKLQAVNLVLSLYQFFVLKLPQDNLGGIFGVAKGVNAYTNIYLCIICTFVILKYLMKKIKLSSVLWILGTSLCISALAELKVFFIECVIIVLLAILFSNPSMRTIRIIVYSVPAVCTSAVLLGKLFPEHLKVLLSFAMLSEYMTEAIAGYEISRLGAFPEINRLFFKDSIIKNLCGYGFGNCETGSAFYERYGDYSYTWFAHQVTFLETGYVGVLLYLLFFVYVFLHATKSKRLNPENGYYYSFTQIICILCGIWFVYNQALRMEVAFLIFFALAVSAIARRSWANGCNGNRMPDSVEGR